MKFGPHVSTHPERRESRLAFTIAFASARAPGSSALLLTLFNRSMPPAATAAPEEPPDDFVQAFAFSPPLFIAWALGYLSDDKMLACLFLMALPWCVRRGVEYLGGRGAWAKTEPPTNQTPKKEAKAAFQAAGAAADAAANAPSDFAQALRLPLSVWLPPMMLMGVTSRDGSDFQYVFTMLAVYCVLVWFHLIAIKMGFLGKAAEAKAAAKAAAAAKAEAKGGKAK